MVDTLGLVTLDLVTTTLELVTTQAQALALLDHTPALDLVSLVDVLADIRLAAIRLQLTTAFISGLSCLAI